MAVTLYGSTVAVYANTTYTPADLEFLPPFLAVRNDGQAPLWINRFSGGMDPFKVDPGQVVEVPIADAQTFRPLLTSTELGANGAAATVLGWIDE